VGYHYGSHKPSDSRLDRPALSSLLERLHRRKSFKGLGRAIDIGGSAFQVLAANARYRLFQQMSR
jgi:hypothetical protein